MGTRKLPCSFRVQLITLAPPNDLLSAAQNSPAKIKWWPVPTSLCGRSLDANAPLCNRVSFICNWNCGSTLGTWSSVCLFAMGWVCTSRHHCGHSLRDRSSLVRWLPGLLVFGAINSFLGLITHHVPTNRGVEVSAGIASLLLAFYTIGCIVSYHYDATHLSAVDRLSFLTYLFCMVWPAFAPNNLSAVTPIVTWSTGVGMAVLVASFVAHRAQQRKQSVRA